MAANRLQRFQSQYSNRILLHCRRASFGLIQKLEMSLSRGRTSAMAMLFESEIQAFLDRVQRLRCPSRNGSG
jgi:hypothetical protein